MLTEPVVLQGPRGLSVIFELIQNWSRHATLRKNEIQNGSPRRAVWSSVTQLSQRADFQNYSPREPFWLSFFSVKQGFFLMWVSSNLNDINNIVCYTCITNFKSCKSLSQYNRVDIYSEIYKIMDDYKSFGVTMVNSTREAIKRAKSG